MTWSWCLTRSFYFQNNRPYCTSSWHGKRILDYRAHCTMWEEVCSSTWTEKDKIYWFGPAMHCNAEMLNGWHAYSTFEGDVEVSKHHHQRRWHRMTGNEKIKVALQMIVEAAEKSFSWLWLRREIIDWWLVFGQPRRSITLSMSRV